MKNDRLKKFESELADLEQWMRLGLVPKKELERHKEEIENLKARITEEKERLQFLKESGDIEEYAAPRKGHTKTVYPETPSMSDVEYTETSTETALDTETEVTEVPTASGEEKEQVTATTEVEKEEEDEEDPFSDKNRWRRGGIIDPDATDW